MHKMINTDYFLIFDFRRQLFGKHEDVNNSLKLISSIVWFLKMNILCPSATDDVTKLFRTRISSKQPLDKSNHIHFFSNCCSNRSPCVQFAYSGECSQTIHHFCNNLCMLLNVLCQVAHDNAEEKPRDLASVKEFWSLHFVINSNAQMG